VSAMTDELTRADALADYDNHADFAADERRANADDHGDAEAAHMADLMIDGALIVKRIVRQGGRIALVSDNPAYPSIDLDGDKTTVDIIGRVIRLTRMMR